MSRQRLAGSFIQRTGVRRCRSLSAKTASSSRRSHRRGGNRQGWTKLWSTRHEQRSVSSDGCRGETDTLVKGCARIQVHGSVPKWRIISIPSA